MITWEILISKGDVRRQTIQLHAKFRVRRHQVFKFQIMPFKDIHSLAAACWQLQRTVLSEWHYKNEAITILQHVEWFLWIMNQVFLAGALGATRIPSAFCSAPPIFHPKPQNLKRLRAYAGAHEALSKVPSQFHYTPLWPTFDSFLFESPDALDLQGC